MAGSYSGTVPPALSAYPNPLRTRTEIRMGGVFSSLAIAAKVYNLNGRLVSTISGTGGRMAWEPKGVSAGVYLLKVNAGQRELSLRLLVQH